MSVSQDSRGHGHGHRLLDAFEALEGFPALAESRERLLKADDAAAECLAATVTAVESDVALTISVLRLAAARPGGAKVESVADAVELVSPAAVRELAARSASVDFFERGAWDLEPERFRLHGAATQRAAQRIAAEIGYREHGRLMVSALLHDIGKLVLLRAYPGYPEEVHGPARTPEERIHAERRRLGVDHALVGGVLARRWGLPRAVASTIERHHSDDERGEAPIVRLADTLAHYTHDGAVAPAELLRCAARVGLGPAELRRVMYDLPTAPTERPATAEPCPLTARELGVLRELATGKVYKEIARALGISPSTARTHLHNVYGKLGATDRAQAVLLATARGWI